MNSKQIVQPGQKILYMKIGIHAQESLEDIIERKIKEIKDEGFAFWGYGGNTCHPTKAVQPFASDAVRDAKKIYVCMHPMNSQHFAEPKRADEFSVDGVNWTTIPNGINVLGSRYALAIKNLEKSDFKIPMKRTSVAVGNCTGRAGDAYIKGRVDKACLTLGQDVDVPTPPDEPLETIGLIATLEQPYAVFLRNKPNSQ